MPRIDGVSDECGDRRLSWTSHPWAEDRPARRVVFVAVVLIASAVAALAFGSLAAGAISLGFLFLSLSRYFTPSDYELTSDGVAVRHLGVRRFFPWSRFRRAALRPEGVFLSTFGRPRRLDVWRGCYLRCPVQREAVYAYARAHIPADENSPVRQPCAGDAAGPRTEPGR